MKKIIYSLIVIGIIISGFFVISQSSGAQENPGLERQIKPEARQQIEALAWEKGSRTATQKKINSNLLYAAKMERGEMIADGISNLETGLTYDERGFVKVDITANVTKNLLKKLEQLDAKIIVSLPEYHSITAFVPLLQIESLAASGDVIFIMPHIEGEVQKSNANPVRQPTIPDLSDLIKSGGQSEFTQRADNVRDFLQSNLTTPETGSVTSEGDTTHQAAAFRAATGANGAGIKIGVMSNGVNSLATRVAQGDLPPNVTVISGQAGSGDEGTAMLEIVYDIAPGAQLYYATASTGLPQFAQNIRALRAAGCTIIIDDLGYSNDSVFQNGQAANVVSPTNGGVVIQAVNDVTVGSMAGALYFSSAANSGNKNDGTSSTWEGDFVDAGAAGGILQGAGNLHNFGGSVIDPITQSGSGLSLQWSDPLGGSNNDYDVYIVDGSGSFVVAAATDTQSGTQDPFEFVNSSNANTAGNSVVITKYSGAARFLHLDGSRNRFSISTPGSTKGHNAGVNSISTAAVPTGPAVNGQGGSVGPFPNPFNSSNQVEKFSSDGPRRIFYNADGSAITPGNVSSTGGQLLAKPDLTAADGVTTRTVEEPGLNPFFGTSAAAPHAGALAALLRQACPSATNAQVLAAFKATAIDIEAAGYDRDSGAGIMMPIPAKAALCSAAPTNNKKAFDFDGDGKADVSVFRPSTGTWYLQRSTAGFTGTTFGQNGDVITPADYDGDGKTDVAVYRNGTWYLLRSQLGFTGVSFGASGDIPAPADFDGDGKADLAVFRPSAGAWYILGSTAGFYGASFGLNGDKPVAADYDGDGKADIAVVRNGTWYLQRSQLGFVGVSFGLSSDKFVPADYDGDGKADLAVFRPSTGAWYLQQSTAGFTGTTFGQNGDLPTAADYDGDGKTDIAVFRPSNGAWYLNRTTAGFTGFSFGLNSDSPAPNAYVR